MSTKSNIFTIIIYFHIYRRKLWLFNVGLNIICDSNSSILISLPTYKDFLCVHFNIYQTSTTHV